MTTTIVLITGANSGVGYATAKVIAQNSSSYHVILTARSLEKLETAVAEIEASNVQGQVEEKFGRLDVLINNAGVGNRDPDLKTRLQACLDANTIGPALVSEAFRPLLFKSQNPYSIYVSSGAGSLEKGTTMPIAFEFEEAYRMSKAAINMYAVRELFEYGSKGLKVFTMSPGFVVSNLRGPSEEMRTGWGKAGDPAVSGQTILSIMEGQRDSDMGKFVIKEGLCPW